MAQEGLQKALSDHKGLIGAYVSSALAAILIRYVASVGHPSFGHVILALIAVLGFLGAFLLVAQSAVAPTTKAGTVIGAAVISGICFAVASHLV